MAKVITFSRVYPSYHPRKGEPTYFIEKIWNNLYSNSGIYIDLDDLLNLNISKEEDVEMLWGGIKHVHENKSHTIRAGHRFKEGDLFSPRVWSGQPYNSRQIIIGPNIEIKKTWNFRIDATDGNYWIGKDCLSYNQVKQIALNDGLLVDDFECWFERRFEGQIICWNENIEY